LGYRQNSQCVSIQWNGDQQWPLREARVPHAEEWNNGKRAKAITPAGQMFPTDLHAKDPDRVFTRSEWTSEMLDYAEFVEAVSPGLVGHKVTLQYVEDKAMVCGQFFGAYFNVNLARHAVSDWQRNIELMLHELAHTVVQSNDHLSYRFYETVGVLGAKLALLLAKDRHLASTIA
jgi:hypothetical protein